MDVLNGVDVDGVGVIFPLFFMQFSPFSSLFSASPKGQGHVCSNLLQNGEFHSYPVCTDPVQNFPDKSGKSRKNREIPNRTKKDKKGRTGPDQEAPRLKTPRLVAPLKTRTGTAIEPFHAQIVTEQKGGHLHNSI